jgi:hypothetical protein
MIAGSFLLKMGISPNICPNFSINELSCRKLFIAGFIYHHSVAIEELRSVESPSPTEKLRLLILGIVPVES